MEASDEQIANHQQQIEARKFVIPDPNQELTTIYIVSALSEIAQIRADLEHDKANPELGRQNPVYDKLVELVEKSIALASKGKAYQSKLDELASLLNSEPVSHYTNFQPDVRLAESLQQALTCLASYCYGLARQG